MGDSHIKITFHYESLLTSQETDPMIRFYTSAQDAPRTKMVDVLVTGTTEQDVNIPADLHNPLRRGDAIFAQVYTKIKSAEGHYLYQKDGAAMFFLEKLIKPGQTEHFRHSSKDDPTHTHEDRVPVRQHVAREKKGEALQLQSMMIFQKEMPVKGTLNVRIHTRFSEHAFLPPNVSDYVPENIGLLNALIRSNIDKSMALFDPKQKAALGVTLEATQPEIKDLCAPYWVTNAGVGPGSLYWLNVNQVDPWSEQVIHDTLTEVIQRYDMTESMFANGLNAALEDFDDMDTIVQSAAILGEVVCAPSSTVHYLADVRIVQMKDSTDLHRTPQMVRITVENFAKDGPSDAMGGVNADDCEGTANFNGECFRSIRDQVMTRKGTMALQRLARMYAGAGTLVTVTAPNVSEDDKKKKKEEGEKKKGPSRIGDEEDLATKPGAHEKLDLISKRVVFEQAVRLSPGERNTLRWNDGSLMCEIPEEQRKLPTIVCEGTGLLYPLFLADEAYKSGTERKVSAIEKQEYRLEAFTRLLFGETYSQRRESPALTDRQKKTEVMFTKYGQFMRGKNSSRAFINDPDIRGTFYRMQARKLFIPEANDPIYDLLFPSSRPEDVIQSTMEATKLESSLTSIIGDQMGKRKQTAQVEVRMPTLHWLETIPVTCGKRPERFSDRAYEEAQTSTETITYGTNTMDELNKQPYVGLLRTPAFTEEEAIAIRALIRSIPPTPEVKPMTKIEHEHLNKLQEGIGALIHKTLSECDKDERPPISSKAHKISYWVRTPDITDTIVSELASHAAQNHYVMTMDVHVERYAHTMSTIRFDFLVNMVGWKGIKRTKAEQGIVKHSRS